jgi:DUF1680 family protein
MTTTDYPIQPVNFSDVRVTGGMWAKRIETNRDVTVPFNFRKCEETPRVNNFILAAKKLSHPFNFKSLGEKLDAPSEWKGLPFDDSDIYKIIEGAAYTLAMHPDAKLDAYLDGLISLIAAAQEEDGYLYTPRTAKGADAHEVVGPTKFSNESGQIGPWDSHELYNVGHMYEAAVAHFHATGKRSLLDVALRSADLIAQTWGEGEGKLKYPSGHQEIELGLVKLFRVTGDEKYLNLAHFLLECRGRGVTKGTYRADHIPVVEQKEAVGHSVRSAYMYAAMTDIAAILKDEKYREAVDALWTDVVTKKLFLHGGIGARPQIEGFDEPYLLPNQDSYNETCAAIALALWAHRMFLLHGDAKYIDVLERIIYNGFLAGIGLDGKTYFYPNPLAADTTTNFNHKHLRRAEWFGCSCCPGNVVRFVPSIAGYVYASRDTNVFVNLYLPSETSLSMAGTDVKLSQETNYPWEGEVKVNVSPEKSATFAIRLRIPSFVSGAPLEGDLYRYLDAAVERPAIRVNGKEIAFRMDRGFAVLERTWNPGDIVTLSLPMRIHRVIAHEKVEADRGRVAIERGPIVFCAEGIDNNGKAMELKLSDRDALHFDFNSELLDGVGVIRGSNVTLIPYYAWAHRELCEMSVWLKRES